MTETIWEPAPGAAAATNVGRFMAEHGISSFEELRRRSIDDVAWFWDAVVRFLGIPFSTPYTEVLDGCIMPDALMWIVARMIEAKRVRPAVQHRLALSLGCTSAIGWGGTT